MHAKLNAHTQDVQTNRQKEAIIATCIKHGLVITQVVVITQIILRTHQKIIVQMIQPIIIHQTVRWIIIKQITVIQVTIIVHITKTMTTHTMQKAIQMQKIFMMTIMKTLMALKMQKITMMNIMRKIRHLQSLDKKWGRIYH